MDTLVGVPLISDIDVALHLAASTALWGLITLAAMRLCKDATYEYVTRVVSFIHSVASVAACIAAIISSWPNGYYCAPMNHWEMRAIAITTGYFIMDTVGMCSSKALFDTKFFVHHIFSIIAFGVPLVAKTNGFEVVIALLLLECSNPAMHAHWLLADERNVDKVHPALATFARRSFYATFVIGRFVCGPVSFYNLTTRECCWNLHIVIGAAFPIASMAFFVDLMMKVQRKESWR